MMGLQSLTDTKTGGTLLCQREGIKHLKMGSGVANEGRTWGIQEGRRDLPRGLEGQQNTQVRVTWGRQDTEL